MHITYPFSRIFLFPVVRFFTKRTIGLENVPIKGPYIIACKHIGALDGLFVGAVITPKINQKIHFVANIAPWGWFWKKIVAEQWSGCIPFLKEHPQICLDIAATYLKEGKIVGIFPEGVMQEHDAKKYRAKTGVARLAIWMKVPILPIGLRYAIRTKKGPLRLYSPWKTIAYIFKNPQTMEICIGKTFTLSEYYDRELDKDAITEATHKVMDRIEAQIPN